MLRVIADSVVVITGASSGIGRATTMMFAQQGATVVLAARREPALKEVVRACERNGARALAECLSHQARPEETIAKV